MPSRKQEIAKYNKNPTKCYFCKEALPYSDLRSLSAAIKKTVEICSKPECIAKYRENCRAR